MMKRRKKSAGESGQAIIEFVVVSAMILTLIFLFVQIAWGIAYGHYVHYATYMASRAFLSGDATKQDQMDSATAVLQSMLKTSGGKDLFPFIAKARGGDQRDAQGNEPVTGAMIGTHPTAAGMDYRRAYTWAEGVQYNFNLSLFLIPLSPAIASQGKGQMVTGGRSDSPTKAIEYKGAIPMTSDSFLGREVSTDECQRQLHRLSQDTGISRGDSQDFLEDNGC